MIRRPPRSTRTDTLFPYTTLFRAMSASAFASTGIGAVMPSLLGVAGREREKFDPAQIHCRPLCYRWTVAEGSNPRRLTMLCPECGEVIGSGPLDARRARHGGEIGRAHV